MKKWLFLTVVGLMTATACEKDWTCTCTVNGIDYDTDFPSTKKSDAKDACNALEDAAQDSDPDASCNLH